MPGNAKKKCAKPGSLYVRVQRQIKNKADEWESIKANCLFTILGGNVDQRDASIKDNADYKNLCAGSYSLKIQPKGEEANFELTERVKKGTTVIQDETPIGSDALQRPVTIERGKTRLHFYKFYARILRVIVEDDQGKKFSGLKVKPTGGPTEIAEKTSGNDGLTDFGYVKKSDFTLQATLPADKKDKYCVTLPELNGKKGIVPAQELGAEPYKIIVQPVIRLYLKLCFKDPEDNERDFPKDFELKLNFEGDLLDKTRVKTVKVGDDGLVTDDGKAYVEVPRAVKSFTMDFQQKEVRYLVCEKLASPAAAKTVALKKEDELDTKDPAAFRSFKLPTGPWHLGNAKWKVTGTAAYKEDKQKFEELEKEDTTVGSPGKDKAVKILLDPCWQFYRFEMFDRYYGHASHGDKAVALPPLFVDGFFERPAPAETKTAEDKLTALETAGADAATKTELYLQTEFERNFANEELANATWDHADFVTDRANKLSAYNAAKVISDAEPGNAAKQRATNLADSAARYAKFKREEANARKTRWNSKFTTANSALAGRKSAMNTAISTRATKLSEFEAAEAAAMIEIAKAKPDTICNWTINPANDLKKLVQCVPWIIRKFPNTASGAPAGSLVEKNKPDKDSILQFTTKPNTFVFSKSATERNIVVLDPNPAGTDAQKADAKKLVPGPDRFRYYDLPEIWKSQKYFVRLESGAGLQKSNRWELLAGEATAKDSHLVFTLEDIVLTRDNLLPLHKFDWNVDKRLALFSHRFRNKNPDDADLSSTGLWKPDTAAKKSFLSKKPDTATPAAGTNPGAKAVEKDRNYISQYPNWTRLIVAAGNLYDVFERRTKNSATRVVGARAAVRYVDVTQPIAGCAFGWRESNPPDPGGRGFGWDRTDTRPFPNRWFTSSRPGIFPALSPGQTPVFAIQPYFEQQYRRCRNGDSLLGIGRFDMALLRCCDLDGAEADAKEVAINLHYLRNHFVFIERPRPYANPDTATVPANESPLVTADLFGGSIPAPKPTDVDDFADKLIANVNKRWNGDESGASEHRAEIRPATGTSLRVQVVWFGQFLPYHSSQFVVRVEDKWDLYDATPADPARTWNVSRDARDNRGGYAGTGESSPGGYQDSGTDDGFASAHECGHADGLPDEYNERWDGGSYGQLSWEYNMPGDPYEPDGRIVEFQKGDSGMMNGNKFLRNRYFWHSAEWVRRLINQKVKVVLGAYDDYQVPPHELADRAYSYTPIEQKLDHKCVPVAPLTVNRGECTLYLYTLGKDKYSVDLLTGADPGAGAPSASGTPAPFDGILIVFVKMQCWLPNFGGDNRKDVLKAMAGAARKLNFKYYLKGKVRDGTDQVKDFAKCLIHFSPRFAVEGAPSVPTIPADTLEVQVQPMGVNGAEWVVPPARTEIFTEAEWTSERSAAGVGTTVCDADIKAYHKLDAKDVANRVAKLKAIKKKIEDGAEPANAIRGDWDTKAKTSEAGCPAGVTEITQCLTAYESIDVKSVDDRLDKLEELSSKIDSFTATAGYGISAGLAAINRKNAATSLKDRVTAKVKEIKLYATLKTRCEERLPHYEGVPEIPTAAEWSSQRTTAGLTDTSFDADITAYHALAADAIKDRIDKLKEIKTKCDGHVEGASDIRGDWNAKAKTGEATCPASITAIDTKIGAYEGISRDKYAERIRKLEALAGQANAYTSHAGSLSAADAANQPVIERAAAAGELRGRIQTKIAELKKLKLIASLKKQTEDRIWHYGEWPKSRIMRIKYNSPADNPTSDPAAMKAQIENGFYELFPHMFGVYKKPADLTKDHVKKLITEACAANTAGPADNKMTIANLTVETL